MYFEKAKILTNEDWERKLSFFDVTEEEKLEIRQILTLGNKIAIESQFDRLYELGIINGVGPGYFCHFFRKILGKLFIGVKWEFHDINYLIGGDEKDRIKADLGLLKYSLLTIWKNILKIKEMETYYIVRGVIYIIYIVLSIPQALVAVFCFLMVFLFGRFGSFQYNTIINTSY